MSKDTKTIQDIIDKANESKSGYNEASSNIQKTLESFRDAANLAIKNKQAQDIDDGTKDSNTTNITKPSRTGKSKTIVGLAKLQGFHGFIGAKKKKTTNKDLLS